MAVVIDPTTGITAPAAAISGALSASSIASTTEAFTNTPAVSTAQSMVRLNTANGYGSTNTMIRRFTNVDTTQGSDITYADSAANGATFTINTNGTYAISYTDDYNALTVQGISLNSNQLTTAVHQITASAALSMQNAIGANTTTFCGWVGYLPAGSIVRAHDSGAPTGNVASCRFTITRVS